MHLSNILYITFFFKLIQHIINSIIFLIYFIIFIVIRNNFYIKCMSILQFNGTKIFVLNNHFDSILDLIILIFQKKQDISYLHATCSTWLLVFSLCSSCNMESLNDVVYWSTHPIMQKTDGGISSQRRIQEDKHIGQVEHEEKISKI